MKQDLLSTVADVCGVTVDQILNGNRDWPQLRARYMAAEVAAQSLDPNATEQERDKAAAQALGITQARADRFRSNAQHLYDTDPMFRADYESIADALQIDY